jgi:hypothetical protein
MTTAQSISNPFALLMNPEVVLAAMAGSERLARLNSRVCRPLDRPLIARADAVAEVEDDTVDDVADAVDHDD